MDKKNNNLRRKQEDTALNRGLLWVAGAIVLEFLLLLLNRYYINYNLTEASVNIAYALSFVLKWGRVVGLLGMAAAAVWTAVRLCRKGCCGAAPVAVTCACGAVAVCAHITFSFKEAGVRMLFLLVPAWAALALVYYLYQKEFFLSGVVSGFAAVGIWLLRASAGRTLWFILAAGGVLLVAAVALVLKKNGGVLRFGDKELRALPAKTSYLLIFLSCAVSLAALLVAMAAGATIAYYLIYAIVAWLFVLLVYYTVKLM